MKAALLQRKCACGSPTSSLTGQCAECKSKKRWQAKLSIGVSNDPLEQEADRVADQVLAAPANPAITGSPQRIRRFTGQDAGRMGAAPTSVERALASPGRPLDSALSRDMEQRFGHDFSRVRIHSGAAAEQSARDVNASAYTAGQSIVFGAGKFAPATLEGRRLLAHELTHVVQQGGAGSPGLQRKGRPTMDLFVEAPFKGRILSSGELKKSGERAKAHRFTGQLDAQVCEVPDPKKARQCTALAAGSEVRVKRIVNWPILYADDGVWVEGGAGWYEIERPDAPGKTGFVLGVFVDQSRPPPPAKEKTPEKKQEEEPPALQLPAPEIPKEPPGPKRPAPGGEAVETFCKPFASKELALKVHATAKALLMSFTSKFGSDVQDLSRTYLDTPKTGTKGTLPARKLFGDQQSRVVKEFRDDPETLNQRDTIFWKIFAGVKDDPDLIPPTPGQSTKFHPFRKVLKDGDLLDLPMRFRDPFNRIPGLIAGGFGKNSSDAGNDVRNVDGLFAVTRTGDFDIRLSVLYTFDIFDAVDFCPGAPGSLTAQLAITDDLSRLEATPDVPTYDTPFEVVAGASNEQDIKL